VNHQFFGKIKKKKKKDGADSPLLLLHATVKVSFLWNVKKYGDF
jgi:hypothetical protein